MIETGYVVLGALAALIAIGWLGACLADAKGAWKTSRQAVRDLATLDPTLLDVFGYDTYDEHYNGVRRIDVERISRLAETRRTLDKHARHDAELTTALADLARARKDSK